MVYIHTRTQTEKVGYKMVVSLILSYRNENSPSLRDTLTVPGIGDKLVEGNSRWN